ncbi:MAG: ATP-dependent Lon protease [Parcubacteria group bacterium LiPW_72]|nr:MAG: ATP-dependent Lon protease [Parcubacteria group bacterium LiPW_72]
MMYLNNAPADIDPEEGEMEGDNEDFSLNFQNKEINPLNPQKPQIKKVMPLVAVQDAVIFPKLVLPLIIRDKKSVAALQEAVKKEHLALFVTQISQKKEEGEKEEIEGVTLKNIYKTGTVAMIVQDLLLPDGSIKVIIEGMARAKILDLAQESPFFKVRIKILEPKEKNTLAVKALIRNILAQFKECVSMGKMVPLDVLVAIFNAKTPDQMIDLIVFNLDLSLEERQKILETADIQERLALLSRHLAREKQILETGKRIERKTQKELGKMQKEMFLREQLKSIQKELGEGEGAAGEDLQAKIKMAKMPENVEKVALKELARMEQMPSFSPEISYLRTYLDWLIDLPWSREAKTEIDIKKAEKILAEDHYGLEKIKERIIEYLAVQKMVGKIKGPILCFVGPPGTGKTSIGKSIARSLGRKFFRMSLGGIRDEAEIRGHRRTYVGALPGRIIQGMNTVGEKNPVFMLDEIDKVGKDFRGDPTSALLEALDPEQNYEFSDHYLEVPFDLSKAMFITTANVLDTIPSALRDRMEVIHFPGYTEDEKLKIAKRHLLPKLYKSHGLKNKDLLINDAVIRAVITEYTREAGVRNLEREIATLCRKIVRKIAGNGKKKSYRIKLAELGKYLGPAKFALSLTEKKNEIGVVTGLAWTQAGGEILSIEATTMVGKGNLILTGQLGDVMKESAQAALSYARSKARILGIDENFFQKNDIHVHVPAGAIPKDGPSAGIAITTALISAIARRPVRREVAMTGEVTLRGNTLEIGGLKEKALAAHRAGAKIVIIPKDNQKDLNEIPKEARDELKFIPVSNMDQVLNEALVPDKPIKETKKKKVINLKEKIAVKGVQIKMKKKAG